MPRIKLCRLDELEDIDSRGFEVTEELHDIFIVRNYNRVSAYHNSCPHNHSPLNWSEDQFLDYGKEYIQCASHGALFEMDSGECIYGPCMGENLTMIECEVVDGHIYIEI